MFNYCTDVMLVFALKWLLTSKKAISLLISQGKALLNNVATL